MGGMMVDDGSTVITSNKVIKNKNNKINNNI